MVRASAALGLARRRSVHGGAGLVILGIFTLLGLALAAFMMYVGWRHNSQGEFHDKEGIYWGYSLFLGFTWFIAVTAVPYAVGVCVLVWRRIVRSSHPSSTPTI
jgi:outer membrane phospholipase A